MVKRVLMIAFHFPPVVGSSGVQRTLKFSTYLLDHGWEPTVLTVSPWAYRSTRDDQLAEIPDGVRVIRTWALDSSRHLSFRGRYPSILARPDAWCSWWLSAVPIGLASMRYSKTNLIWSTYPFPTAHVVAGTIQKFSNVPWVADFRDMMVEEDYPDDPRVRQNYRNIEAATVSRAKRVVLTTPGTKAGYMSRYSNEDRNKWKLIRNGYDEDNFKNAQSLTKTGVNGPIQLVHSGLLYPSERDPVCFFQALSELRDHGSLNASRLQVTLRATGHDIHHAQLIEQFDIGDIVKLKPGIGYDQALAEMLSVDGLLIFQASNCNHQVPAKLYEYFRAGKPILALTDPAGDTAQTIYDAGLSNIASLDSKASIKSLLMQFIQAIENGSALSVAPEIAAQYSRRSQTAELARLFDDLVSG